MHPFLRSGFQGKICFISESSGKSSSEEIRIPFLSILLFILTCISTLHFCTCVFELFRNGGETGFLCTLFIEEVLWGKCKWKWKWGEQGGAKKGAEQSRGFSFDPTGTVEDELNTPEMVAPCCQETIFFFAPLSVSHTLWCGGEMGRVCCNSQARRI